MSDPSSSFPSADAMGKLLPNFDFEALLNEGYHSAVYLATQRSLERHVAIKIFSREASGNSAFRVAFERAAQSMAQLKNVNLIGVFDSGEVDKMSYMVMEFVPGKSLVAYRKNHRLNAKQAVAIAKGIANGVAYAHSHGVLHGGLSINNILLDNKHVPKIGSFGFVVATEGEDQYEQYSAPELADPTAVITPEVDVFSLGVILYELVTSKEYQTNARPPSVVAGVNSKLDVVVAKATEPAPEKRYKSAKEFLAAVEKAASSSGARMGSKLKAATMAMRPGGGAARPVMTQQAGFNWNLVRNIGIIIVLLIAIRVVWNIRQNREDRMSGDSDQGEMVKAKVVNQRLEQLKREQERLENLTSGGDDEEPNMPEVVDHNPEPEVVEPVADAWGSLSRLRDKLLNGSRSEMPDGTVSVGACDFLLVDRPMTWKDAMWFAMDHGGHLAVPNRDATPEWLAEQSFSENVKEIWLGAAKSSHADWTFLDGRGWKPGSSISDGGSYLAMGPDLSLVTHEEDVARPFIIQWHRNGSKEGSLAGILLKTKMSAHRGTPIYPPGTQAYGARHYWYVPKSLTWEQAKRMAILGGGNLAVVSGVAEAFNLKTMSKSLDAENGAWYGAAYDDGKWSWVTGEPWDRENWADEEAPDQSNGALVVMPGHGWIAKDRDQPVSGFVIEWSDDAK